MKNLFGAKKDPEQQAREAIRRKKWPRAISFYERKLQSSDRDFALWNLVGDLYANAGQRARAVEGWRRALDGYALEGLYENVLGLARKILRKAPEEEDVYLVMAEAYLGMECYADSLVTLRRYLRTAKQRSEADLRSLVKKILDAPLQHAHLYEELDAVYREAGIEDIELDQRVSAVVRSGIERAPARKPVEPTRAKATTEGTSADDFDRQPRPEDTGLVDLEHLTTMGDDAFDPAAEFLSDYNEQNRSPSANWPSGNASFAPPKSVATLSGDGKDHYDLGLVYKEMRLWDAAIAEFEQARQDPSLRLSATLSLAECHEDTHDLRGALELLESVSNEDGQPEESCNISLHLGVIHELLGNLEEAVKHFDTVRNHGSFAGDPETRIDELRGRIQNRGN